MATTAYVSITGFAQGNPGVDDQPLALLATGVILDADGAYVQSLGYSVNVSPDDDWPAMLAKMTANMQVAYSDPGISVVIMPPPPAA